MSESAWAENVRLKRVYEPPQAGDGKRVFVDRLWPRGLCKQAAAIDLWVKDLAPSTGLRKWFGHDPDRWPEFRMRYATELQQNSAGLRELRGLAEEGPVSLLYAARDKRHNHALVLREVLLGT